jgi:hypothetical protein
LIDPATLEQLITADRVNPSTTITDVERLRLTTAASTQLAVITSAVAIERQMIIVSRAISGFIEYLYQMIGDRMVTDAELERTLAGTHGWIDQLREFGFDVERRMRVEPMRTVNPPMWEDDDDER